MPVQFGFVYRHVTLFFLQSAEVSVCDRCLRSAAESQEQSAEQQQLKGGSEHLQPAGRFAFAKW